jgi:hypothetical protein
MIALYKYFKHKLTMLMSYGADKLADEVGGYSRALTMRVTTQIEPYLNLMCIFVNDLRTKSRDVIKKFIEICTNGLMDEIDN